MTGRPLLRRAMVVPLLACGLVLGACGFPTEDEPAAIQVDELTAPTAESTPPEVPIDTITVWFARDGQLSSTTREVPLPIEPDAVVGVLGAGVTDDEAEGGLRSAIPSSSMLLSASTARGTVTVQLSAAFAEIPVGDQSLAIAQIVFTLTELRGVGRVRFEIDGEAIAVPLPDGTSTEDSVSRDDFLDAASG